MPAPIRVVKKLCVLGSRESGKTSLVRRYVSGEFPETYEPSVGARAYMRDIEVPPLSENAQGYSVKLFIWDVLGDMERAPLVRAYLQGAAGAVVVCDPCREATVKEAHMWRDFFTEHCGGSPVILAANKSDVCPPLPPGAEDGFLKVFRVSARSGDGIEEMFYFLALRILEVNPY